MNTLNRIQQLAKHRGITVKQFALEIGIGENTIYRWDKTSPASDKLQKVADYFEVSTDYLLCRTEKKQCYELTEEGKDIAEELEEIIANLKQTSTFSGSKNTTEIDEVTRELLITSLETSLRIVKIEAEKYRH